MEVHHHSHTPRRKWTHYFWEFFMLFLAVTLGFFVENQREHYVEHQREKQFMRSLMEDLEMDTSGLNLAIAENDSTYNYLDSTLNFLLEHDITDSISNRFVDLISVGGQYMSLINTDRTSSQLKNSGGMRLIRNKKVVNSILGYWNQIELTNNTLDRYMLYRNAIRELSFKLFRIPQVYIYGNKTRISSINNLAVIDKDPQKWGEFANLLAVARLLTSTGYQRNLKKQKSMAVALIHLIRQEYHLK